MMRQLFKMAMKNNEDQSKSLSFKFAKQKKSTKLPLGSNNKAFHVNKEETYDIDFVLSAEGREIKR